MKLAQEIFGDLKNQVTGYLNEPGVTEQYTAREMTAYLSSKGFKAFEAKFPEQAKKIKAAFAGKDLQSRAIMFVISLIFKNKKVKEMTPPMVATIISDVMSEITAWIGSGDPEEASGALYPGLESKLLMISPESLENYINWQDSLNDLEFSKVCDFLSTKSVEEIDALLALDLEKRNKVMSAFLRLRQRPTIAAETGTPTEKAASPLLVSLKKLKGGLQLAHDRMTTSDVRKNEEGS